MDQIITGLTQTISKITCNQSFSLLCLSSHLVVLFDDVLRRQRVVLQVSGQVEHVLRQLLLQVVVVLQDRLQLCSRLTLIHRETSAHRHGNNVLI